MPPLMARGKRWLLWWRRLRRGKGWTTAAHRNNPARAGAEGWEKKADPPKSEPCGIGAADLNHDPTLPNVGVRYQAGAIAPG